MERKIVSPALRGGMPTLGAALALTMGAAAALASARPAGRSAPARPAPGARLGPKR